MEVVLRKLSLTDGEEEYLMVLEMGRGENGFVNVLALY